MTQPVVSVIIPTYNAARWLGLAVDSALNQTLRDIEVLVFDNASTDATPQVMARYTDPRLTYVCAAKNVGFAGNVTRGIRAAAGRYFMVLGADDVLEPDFLAAAIARLEADPKAVMLHGGAIWIDDDGLETGRFSGAWPERSTGAEAFLRCFTAGFCYSTVISRTAPVKTLGAMDERWGMISDTWLFLKLCLVGDVLFLPKELVRYRVRESSLSFELYADGKMFEDHLRGLEEAFCWPEARSLAMLRQPARVAVAQQALDTLHMTRLGSGWWAAMRKAASVIWHQPAVMLSLRAWARIVFAALPAPMIRALRSRRKQVALGRAASPAGKA